MKTARKMTALWLCLCLVLSLLSACGREPQPETTVPETQETQRQTEPEETTAPAPEEEFLPREEGMKQLTLYWDNKTGADPETCDVWMWFPGKDGRGYKMTPCAYGLKAQINVPADVMQVGFIVRKACSDPGGSSWGSATKDFDGDRFAELTGEETFIYLKSGEEEQYQSFDGGKTLVSIRAFTMAGIISENEIRYSLKPAVRLTDLSQVKVTCGGQEAEVEDLSSLNNEVVTGVIRMKEPLDITKEYQVTVDGYGTLTAVPTGIFDSPGFIEKYTYDGDDLGAVIHGDKTVFKVWAPTASAVVLNLFKEGNGGSAYETLPMERGDRGVWSVEAPCGHGTYYTYTVTTSAGAQEAVDPYAKSAGVNGERGMVLDASLTDPDGFDKDAYVKTESYEDAVIWEVHVRDFSNRIAGSAYPGKYMAFTETGLKNASGRKVGVDYLKELGITHVHLQPVYDYATVDESSDSAQFNWGYDPKNYNVPEGSYSTDPYHGEVRVKEFKAMVQALHRAGIGVVMDVVYNHTYDKDSSLNRIVPYYYYRLANDGSYSNGSGCGNETASERPMFRKFIVDSVSWWQKEYHLDGFRFDLMGLHDVETMQAVEQAAHKENPSCLLYGEGWTGGTTPLMPARQAVQANIAQVTAQKGAAGAVSVFNDAIRDGLKGSVFDAKDPGYISGDITSARASSVAFGIRGGQQSPGIAWAVETGGIINYMSCHDNLTLWDKLTASRPDASDEDKAAMVRFGAAVVMISRGTPLFLAGEEMLRTKGGDENSYASSDEVNNIDWDALKDGSLAAQTMRAYQELIRLRRENSFLRRAEASAEVLSDNRIHVVWTKDGKTAGEAYINPYDQPVPVSLPSGMKVLWGSSETESGKVRQLEALSVLLLKK